MRFQQSMGRRLGMLCGRIAPFLAATALLAVPGPARALPSFAEQTGMPCSQCHTVGYGPALTPYGREFKLNAYALGDVEHFIPLALMVQGGYTHTSADQPSMPAPHTSTNDNFSIDQTSLFFAGRIGQHAGAFVQATYSGPDRHANWDNLDIRYARAIALGNTGAVVGVSVNNNPTVQDLWNSTPAWGAPYITSALAPSPTAGPVIGGFAQTVLGATAYAMIDGHYYLEAGGYRGLSDRWLSNTGLTPDASAHLDGIAPYWRAAYQAGDRERQWSIGTFGMQVDVAPDPTVAARDRYTDIGFDATFQESNEGPHAVAVNFAAIREHATLDASVATGAATSTSSHLTALHADVTYSFRRTWVGSVEGFDTSGSSDSVLYAPNPLDGSNNGSPDSRGYILQLEWIPFGKLDSFARPWLNVRIGLQYTGYTKFNGGDTNYDGFGRSAHDNNTLFAYFWVIG